MTKGVYKILEKSIYSLKNQPTKSDKNDADTDYVGGISIADASAIRIMWLSSSSLFQLCGGVYGH